MKRGTLAFLVAGVVAAGQSTKPWTPPRTPDGQPDISGLYVAIPLPRSIETPLVPVPNRQSRANSEFSYSLNERPKLPEGAVARPVGVDPPDGRIPLTPAALALGPLGLGLELLGLAGMGRPRECSQTAEASALAVLAVALVDHGLSFAEAGSGPAKLHLRLLDQARIGQEVRAGHCQRLGGVDHGLVAAE